MMWMIDIPRSLDQIYVIYSVVIFSSGCVLIISDDVLIIGIPPSSLTYIT